MASTVPAFADFWSDAGAKFKGVTLHGVTESTPPSNYIKDVLAPEFEKKTGIKVEIETTSWDQMYDKAIKDMEAKTGIYDMVYIEQDIIYAYLARNFLVDITKTLKDDPSLKAPDYDESHFTTFANYSRARTATCSACRWKPSSRSISTARICSTIRRSRKPSRPRPARIWPRQDA